MGSKFSRFKLGAFGALTAFAGATGFSSAEPVTLTALDGSISMSGDLISFEDGYFVIATSLGDWRIESAAVNCEGIACPVEVLGEDIAVAGSDLIGKSLLPLLLAGFAASNDAAIEVTAGETSDVSLGAMIGDSGFGEPIGNFSVTSTSSNDAFVALESPDTFIGMSTRRILPAEARRIARLGGGNMIDISQEHVIAIDPVVVIVNEDNPVQQISMTDLDRIYSGQVVNWSRLGGPNAPIVVYGREDGSGLAEAFDQAIFAASGRRQTASVIEVFSDEEMSRSVVGEANAIGFVSFAFIGGAAPVDLLGECGISVSPDQFTAKAEEYPIQRRLYFYNRNDNIGEVSQEFLDFTLSTDADGVIAKSGFVSLSVVRDERQFQGNRAFDVISDTVDPAQLNLMREMVVEILQYDRLSTTFRFASGSASLEAKALSDLERLIEFINESPTAVEISFVGFSDSDGSFEANRSLSVGRAQQVAASVAEFAQGRITNTNGVTFTAKGFGELSPVACNSSLEGKQTNRRVEVWVRAR
ncbi:MAG: substrate-binding domain-containing protein [Rhodobacteraceae bacterium]|nr:substrate-binding domain-containing protein [Paracoccaceae bacterium]